MKALFKMSRFIWKYSLFLTLPVTLFFGTWAYDTFHTYQNYSIPRTVLGTLRPTDLYNVGKLNFIFQFRNLKNILLLNSYQGAYDFELFIDEDSIKALNSNLPQSGFKYKSAQLLYPDGIKRDIKVRYRGDNAFHWFYEKKSFRIKTQKDDIYRGARRFNLIVPKSNAMLNNHLTYILARQLGLLAPKSEMVTVGINSEFAGIKLYVEQLDESFLRNNRRIPGDIYKGENIGNSALLGMPMNNLFSGAYFWEKAAYNNHYKKKDKSNMKKLLLDLYNGDINMLNLESFAKLSVLLTLTQSKHLSITHNWRLYFDPAKEKFEPIVWDILGWWKGFMPKGGDPKSVIVSGLNDVPCDIWLKLFENNRFLKLRNEVLLDFFQNHEEIFLGQLDTEMNLLRAKFPSVEYSINIDQQILERDETFKAMNDFKDEIVQLFAKIKETCSIKSNIVNNPISQDKPTQELNGSLVFQGDQNKLLLNTEKVPNSTFSIEFWFKTNTSHSEDTPGMRYITYLHDDTKATLNQPGIIIGNNSIGIYEYEDQMTYTRIIYDATLDGWNHLALVYNQNEPSLYINGEMVANKKALPTKVGPKIWIESQYEDSGELTTYFDEFRIWDKALSHHEILSNMNNELTGEEPGLKLYHNFNKLINDTIIEDVSGNSSNSLLKFENFPTPTSTYRYSVHNNRLRVMIQSHIPTNQQILIFNKRIPANVKVRTEYLLHGEVVSIDNSNDIDISENSITLNQTLMAKTEFVNGKIMTSPSTFDIVIEGVPLNSLVNTQFQLQDVSNTKINPMEVSLIKSESFFKIKNVIPDPVLLKTLIWKGQKTITGMQTFNNDIVILPGTKVIMAPDAMLKITGKLTAKGTELNPIEFSAFITNESWGTVTLFGAGANGSEISYCNFKNGSSVKEATYEYSGMLSVHNVENVNISHCIFSDNQDADDMLHVVYSKVTIENSKFNNAFSDAIDADISKVTISKCEFIGSGNDAIDLMTTEAIVIDCRFDSSLDKGITAGEGSSLFACNNVFTKNAIALQCKEASIAMVCNSLFEDNLIAMDSYKKNWRYGNGGFINVSKSVFRNNHTIAGTDDQSKIELYDCYVAENKIQSGNIKLSFCDQVSQSAASNFGISMVENLPEFSRMYSAYANDSIRGLSKSHGAITP